MTKEPTPHFTIKMMVLLIYALVFQNRLKQLILNTKHKLIFISNKLTTPLKLKISQFNNFKNNKEVAQVVVVIKTIIGYGLIIYPILYTFFGYEFDVIFIFGCGGAHYIVYDFINYVITEIKKGRKS